MARLDWEDGMLVMLKVERRHRFMPIMALKLLRLLRQCRKHHGLGLGLAWPSRWLRGRRVSFRFSGHGVRAPMRPQSMQAYFDKLCACRNSSKVDSKINEGTRGSTDSYSITMPKSVAQQHGIPTRNNPDIKRLMLSSF
jgi:hypothetical protein